MFIIYIIIQLMYNIVVLSLLIFISIISKKIKNIVQEYYNFRQDNNLIIIKNIFIKFEFNMSIINIILLYSVMITSYFYYIILGYKIYQLYKLKVSMNILRNNILYNFDTFVTFYILGLLYPIILGIIFCFLDPILIILA
jgi:hypothetical protein